MAEESSKMLNPGIWTGICVSLPLHEAMERLAALGWRHFEISDEHLDMLMRAEKPEREIEKALAVKAKLSLETPQAHAHLVADIAQPDAQRRAEDFKWLLAHFSLAKKLGAENVVVHPGQGAGLATREDARMTFAGNVEGFKKLCAEAGKLGLKIGVENLFDSKSLKGFRRFGALPGELMELLEAVAAPNLGITFDSSHANVQRLDLAEALREFGSKLLCTHISDNDGSGDQHRVPGSGSIDWKATMAALKEIGYNGIFNLEVPGERHGDDALQTLKIKNCLAVCQKLCAT
jgi:sugar phosphate isomerase/epimerase